MHRVQTEAPVPQLSQKRQLWGWAGHEKIKIKSPAWSAGLQGAALNAELDRCAQVQLLRRQLRLVAAASWATWAAAAAAARAAAANPAAACRLGRHEHGKGDPAADFDLLPVGDHTMQQRCSTRVVGQRATTLRLVTRPGRYSHAPPAPLPELSGTAITCVGWKAFKLRALKMAGEALGQGATVLASGGYSGQARATNKKLASA